MRSTTGAKRLDFGDETEVTSLWKILAADFHGFMELTADKILKLYGSSCRVVKIECAKNRNNIQMSYFYG